MDEAGSVLASGEDWFLTEESGRLRITIRADATALISVSVGNGRAAVTTLLPRDFITEVLRNKRALRAVGGDDV